MTIEDLRWAQDHLRIISGLWGVLRPLDLIQPYRIEMSTVSASLIGNVSVLPVSQDTSGAGVPSS